MGVAYKPDIDDLRESPALDVIGLLKQKGAEVSYHDPRITDSETRRLDNAMRPRPDESRTRSRLRGDRHQPLHL